MPTEQEILQTAIKTFRERTGIHLTQARYPQQKDIDAALTFKHNKTDWTYFAKVKRHLNRQTLGATIQDLSRIKEKPLLVADYVNPEIAEDLKKMGFPFIDAVGNAFLKELPLHIYIAGNKPKHTQANTLGKAFHPAGLKVLFVLLCKPELVDAPFREIAKYAGVALGTVGKVFEDLETRKHIRRIKRKRILVEPRKLLEQWTMLYPMVLRPKLVVGRYVARDVEWWRKAEYGKGEFLGGEPAADKISQYLKPEVITVYTHGVYAKFVVRNHLKEATEGKVEILKAFWNTELNDMRLSIVPSLLVYTDLLATGEPRNIETAARIYEQELAERFKED